jgi:hypothetical protein
MSMVIVVIGIMLTFLLGMTRNGFSMGNALVGGVAVSQVLVWSGVIPLWGLVVTALLMVILFLGVGR